MDGRNYCLLGTIAISIVGFQLISKVLPWLYLNIFGPLLFGMNIDYRKLGKWAVVTGATDGIGKAYAKALIQKGLNVVLISRSQSKLEKVAEELTAENKDTEILLVAVDFTNDREIYEKIRSTIGQLDIAILVNNVGISYPYPEYFVEATEKNPQFLRDIIAANIHSVTQMCAIVLPGMVNKKKGIIINLSSTAAVIPNPLLTVYSATKAFVDKFSTNLQIEYESAGIIIQSVQPGFVATNMTKIRKPTMFAPSADAYVKSALKTVGIAKVTAGYLPHSLLQLGIQLISSIVGNNYANKVVLNNLLLTRKRALRNLAKKE